jgi:hypothetical protein
VARTVWVTVDQDGDAVTFTCEAAALLYWREMHGSDADFKPYSQTAFTLADIKDFLGDIG